MSPPNAEEAPEGASTRITPASTINSEITSGVRPSTLPFDIIQAADKLRETLGPDQAFAWASQLARELHP